MEYFSEMETDSAGKSIRQAVWLEAVCQRWITYDWAFLPNCVPEDAASFDESSELIFLGKLTSAIWTWKLSLKECFWFIRLMRLYAKLCLISFIFLEKSVIRARWERISELLVKLFKFLLGRVEVANAMEFRTSTTLFIAIKIVLSTKLQGSIDPPFSNVVLHHISMIHRHTNRKLIRNSEFVLQTN